MFTGIIECLATIVDIKIDKSNYHFHVKSNISNQLKIDQSVSHNGVCLTVIAIDNDVHIVTAIDETLQKTNLSEWKVGDEINLERCMIANDRLDGHIVQGHVDTIANCKTVEDKDGSWLFTFEFENTNNYKQLIVQKGSICVNGTSLTVVDCNDNTFSVAIIPFTFENTCFKNIKTNTKVNLEFDIVGKYIQKMLTSS
jgi:riboflavin synthase